ncbi:MAG: DHH family phosphoesterase [Nitrososphaerota archaeon]|nr:DHH family phosphoesterase [Candidatus Calditenuaceae archaeon]MDW8073237.1 DHH family phosphoesterase [Nitrososphaerota archaeon]
MLSVKRDVEAFYAKCKEAADCIRDEVGRGLEVSVTGHNDADGLSSLGIVAGGLLDLGAKFIARSVFRREEFFETAGEHSGKLIILTDMGGGSIGELMDVFNGERLVIIDHHQPDRTEIPEGWVHVNPHLLGIDGESEVSAAGVAYLVMRNIVADAERYAPLAVVGGLGDLQDKGEKRRLVGLNESIVADAVNGMQLRVFEDFILHGRGSRPIHQALAGSQSPYLPGLSGDEAACLSLLVDVGIEVRAGDKWRTLADLAEEEKRTLYNAIVSHLAKSNQPTEMARDLIGTVYELVNEDASSGLRDAREYSQILNACGKTNNSWLGVSLAMGYRGWVLKEAWRVMEQYRVTLKKGLESASKNLEQMYNIVVLRVGPDIDIRHVSSVASILSSSKIVPDDKPLVVLGQEGGIVKVSARASPSLVARGLNLGTVMREAAAKFSGRGGGHRIAAGAEIPAERLTLFLLEADRLVGEAITKAKTQVPLGGDA